MSSFFRSSSHEVSLRRSQSSVASTVPELPGLFEKHSLAEESIDEFVQGKCDLISPSYSTFKFHCRFENVDFVRKVLWCMFCF